MSKTTSHRDFWRMRQLANESRRRQFPVGQPLAGIPSTPRDTPDWEFERLSSKYGFKSMVFDKRRRFSTRQSNSNYVRVLRRAARHRQAMRWQAQAADEAVDRDEHP